MRAKPLLLLCLGFLCGVISWFVGWLLYAQLDLWSLIKPAEFQNILAVSMGLCIIIGAVLAHRSLKSAQSPESNVIEVNKELEFVLSDKKTVTLGELYEIVEELNKNLRDLKPFLPILQKRMEVSKQ